jgi:hypothetical protein
VVLEKCRVDVNEDDAEKQTRLWRDECIAEFVAIMRKEAGCYYREPPRSQVVMRVVMTMIIRQSTTSFSS